MKKNDFSIGELIAVYTDAKDDFFGVGFVFQVDDIHIVLKSIGLEGEYDGLTLYRIDEIVKVERKTKYCQKLEKMMALKNTVFPHYKIPECNFIVWLLNESLREGAVIDIQLLQSGQCDATGIVKQMTDETCVISQINMDGDFDGECQFSIQDVSSIKYNSSNNRSLKKMMESF